MSYTEQEIPDQLRWRRAQRNADGLDPGWLYDRQTDDDHVSGNESDEDWQASGKRSPSSLASSAQPSFDAQVL
jgi:hypothetical protein